MLKGVPGDPNNPPRLLDNFIIYCLQTSQEARDEFDRVVPSLLPAERDRMIDLLERNPGPSQLLKDPQVVDDDFQRTMNTQGVRTRMPQR